MSKKQESLKDKGLREASSWAQARAAVWMESFDWDGCMDKELYESLILGQASWMARRSAMGEAARSGIQEALDGLARDAIASSAPPVSFETEWGVLEIGGRKPGDARSAMNFYPMVRTATPWEYEIKAPKISDPRWAEYAKCRFASALFRRSAERMIVKGAAKKLVEDWIGNKVKQALVSGDGELSPLMAMFEKSEMDALIRSGDAKGPKAKRL